MARTIDGGKTWTLLTSGNTVGAPQLPYVHVDYHCGAFLNGPSGERWLVVGTDGGLYASVVLIMA